MAVSIIGAGVAGATMALALQTSRPSLIDGHALNVFERAQGGSHPGWLTLGPTAMTALEQVGAADQVAAVGFPVQRVISVDKGTTRTFERREPGHRFSSIHIWRRDLLAVLRARLEHRGAITYDAVDAADLEDLAEAGLVIGADGARSKTRRFLIGDDRPLDHAGQSIAYGHSADPIDPQRLPYSVLHFWHGAGHVCGYVASPRDGAFWFCRYGDTPNQDVHEETWRNYVQLSPFGELLSSSDLFGPFALWDRSPEGPWTGPGVVLIGDAAHPLSPASGRGATSAIEDAVILARHLSNRSDVDSATRAFTCARLPRARHTHRPGALPPMPPQPPSDFQLPRPGL